MLISVIYNEPLKDIIDYLIGFSDSSGLFEIYPGGFCSYSIYHDRYL